MQLHELKRKTKNKKSIQVGRGGKRGKTAGRGTKGQKARAGHKIRPEIRDTIKKLPKLRGYAFNTIKDKPFPITLATIEKTFENGAEVTVASLVEAKILTTKSGKKRAVKIVGGKKETVLSKKISVTGIPVTASVRAAIEKAGGTVK